MALEISVWTDRVYIHENTSSDTDVSLHSKMGGMPESILKVPRVLSVMLSRQHTRF
jgi:hypothetical protein